jgi:hypothetical protein
MRPLLLSQIIGCAAAWCIYAFLNDMFKPSQQLFAIIGTAGGVFSYSFLTGIGLRLVFNPHFLTIRSDGTVIHSASLATERFKFSPSVKWDINGRSLTITDAEPNGLEKTFIIPPTLIEEYASCKIRSVAPAS